MLNLHGAYVHRDQRKQRSAVHFAIENALDNRQLKAALHLLDALVRDCRELGIAVADSATFPNQGDISLDTLADVEYLLLRSFCDQLLIAKGKSKERKKLERIKWESNDGKDYVIQNHLCGCLSQENKKSIPSQLVGLSLTSYQKFDATVYSASTIMPPTLPINGVLLEAASKWRDTLSKKDPSQARVKKVLQQLFEQRERSMNRRQEQYSNYGY